MIDGSNQLQRTPAALSPESFQVDETTLADLLSMSRDFAGALTFRDDTRSSNPGQVGGDTWADLLDGDESVVLARGAGLRVGQEESAFLNDYAASRRRRLAGRLSRLVDWLDTWFQTLARQRRPAATALANRIERLVVRALGPELTAMGVDGPATSVAEVCARLRGWLDLDDRDGDPPSPQDSRRLFFAVRKALDGIQRASAAAFAGTLESGAHEPAAGLLVAMLQVFRRVQARINLFTERHLDFYYQDCLRLQPLGVNADSVHLLFKRDPTFQADVIVSRGQTFTAGRSASGADVVFLAADDLTVTDAQVVALKTLRLERDPLIWPEHQFDSITGVKVAEFAAGVGPEAVLQRATAALMGGNVPGCLPSAATARIGLAVSSPVLWLKQGERRVDLTLEVEFPSAVEKAALMSALAAAADAKAFFKALGDLFAAWLLSNGMTLDDDDLDAIRKLACAGRDPYIRPDLLTIDASTSAAFASDPLVILLGEVRLGQGAGGALNAVLTGAERRRLARDALFASLFKIELSTADGWLEITHLAPDAVGPPSASGFLKLRFTLTNADPPIVACTAKTHGPEWPTAAPTLRLTIDEQAPLFPLSLFGKAALTTVVIEVAVDGLQDLVAYNQAGRLDPTKSFAPFGPMANVGDYLAIGALETACKPVTRLGLTLDWSGLPAGGFSEYYGAYNAGLTDSAFLVEESILRDGRWQTGGTDQPLFRVKDRALQSSHAIPFDPAALAIYWQPTNDPTTFDPNARNGFVRLRLSAPSIGFGQQIYPAAMAEALTLAAKRRQAARTLPNPPYTPMLERVTVSYTASTRIAAGSRAPRDAAPNGAESLLHIHPFGVTRAHATAGGGPPAVLPLFDHDGQLLIGLSASRLQGELSLLFELREDTATESLARGAPSPSLQWYGLVEGDWRALSDDQVLSDTTEGFLKTGVVRLDLPPGLVTGNRLLPGDLFWLRVATDAPSDCFAGLQGVHAQALRAERAPGDAPEAPLAAGSITLASAVIPGVLAVRQPSPGFGFRPAETREQQRTRIGERLRHKMRASTPWDYERLVLQAFPTVYKAKCLRRSHGTAPPGGLLIVVVPAASRNDPLYSTRALQLDAPTLNDIAAWLPSYASPLARIAVRNATYEQIQVRCQVGLAPGARFSDVLRRINSTLVEFLSPWHDGGYAADFDWIVFTVDVEACILSLDQVQSVSELSLIRIWESDLPIAPGYHFDDTAQPPPAGTDDARYVSETFVKARVDTSLILPMAEHIIEIKTDDAGKPKPTGIAGPQDPAAGVGVGATLIVRNV